MREKLSGKNRVLQWGPSLLVMALIFLASDTPGSDLPHFGMWDLIVKKGGHMLGYALLAATYMHALGYAGCRPRRALLKAVVMAAIYAVADEVHQSFTAGRSPAIMDVGIDTVGAFLGAMLWTRVRSLLIIKGSVDA